MQENVVTLFRYLKGTNTPHYMTLAQAVERIRGGKSKELIMQLRALINTDKPSYDERKKELPCYLFGGKFPIRGKEHCEEPSGLMTLDYDRFPNTKTMDLERKKLEENPHVVSVFYSPSFKGIKVLVAIPSSNKEDYTGYFKQWAKDFPSDYFDTTTSDISRVCFESYDPQIYTNYKAKVYAPELIDEGYSVTEKAPLFPINDEMEIMEKIMAWGWKKDFVEGERNSFVFDIAGAFCEYGVSQSSAEGYLFNNVCTFGKEFTENEARTAIKSAYRKRQFDSRYFENYQKIEAILSDMPKGKNKVIEAHDLTEDVYEQISEDYASDAFWFFDKKNEVKIDLLKFKFFLENNGFKKHFPSNSQKPIWVKIWSNIVEEVSVEKIKDFTLNYLMKKKEFNVWKRCANYQNIFSENFLVMLDNIELMMLQDSKDCSFIAYRNGILKITPKSMDLISYADVDGYLWKKSIIDRDFQLTKKVDNDYRTFVNNISNGEPTPMECTLGYLISRYKNKTNVKAVILNDEIISDNPEGGTGKGLLVQGLKKIRNVSILDGKSFDDKKSFPYQTVGPETDILVFDDAKKNFDFESKFSLVTEGMTLERKNKDAVKLTVEESPKLLISTNYAIRGAGNSHDRRRHEMEVAQYYTKDNTPRDEFKRELFEDWNAEEFNRFDNYMAQCVQMFFRMGLVEQNAKNIKRRKFIAETAMEFEEWANDRDILPLNIRHDKQQRFNDFINDYKDFSKWLSRKRFNIWLKKYAEFEGFEYREGKTNNDRWFEIIGEGPTTETDGTVFDF